MICRLSQNAVSGIIGAAAFAVLTAGTAAAVTYSNAAITDASTGVHARVTNGQGLQVSQRDPYNGAWARVDTSGRTLVTGTVQAQDPAASRAHALTLTGGVSSGAYLGEVMSADLPNGFVIQSIAGYIEVGNAITPTVTVLVYQNASPASWNAIDVPLMYKSKNGTSDHYQFALDLRAFARKGSKIIVDTSRNDATGPESFRVTFLGYDV